jgi:hypothetical protein
MSKRNNKKGINRKAAAQARLLRYHEKYKKLLVRFGNEHSDWKPKALCWLMSLGIRTLQKYVDTNLDGRITDAPCLTFHFPVDWDWAIWRKTKGAQYSMRVGQFTEANTQTTRTSRKTMAGMLVKHVMILAMQELTANVACERVGNRKFTILTPEAAAALNAITDKKERQAALEDLFQPFCVGALPIEIDVDKLTPNTPVPMQLVRDLERASKRVDMPPLEWICTTDDGHRLRATMIFQIHPFILEPRRKSAYFPLTIGLHIVPDELNWEKLQEQLREPWAAAANWTKRVKSRIWSEILATFDRCDKELGPQPVPGTQAAILSFSAKLKIVAATEGKPDSKVITDRLLKAFSRYGEIQQWECDDFPAGVGATNLRWSKLSDYQFERLLYSLVTSARGYHNAQWLTHTNATDRGRDISVERVVTDSLSGTRRLRVIVQCKHTRSVGIGELSKLKTQMSLWQSPRIDELIIATSGRFSTDAVQWIENHNEAGNALRIVMWANSHLETLLAQRPHLIEHYKLK